jgi:hypothetical protein
MPDSWRIFTKTQRSFEWQWLYGRWDKRRFASRATLIHGSKYNYDKVVYKNPHSKVEIICPKHGIFYQASHEHLKGLGCPKCCTSKGENEIIKWLETEKIEYIHQKTFADCKNPKTNYKLRFDFYLPNKNTLIEFDGIQHFRKHSYFCGYRMTAKDLRYNVFKDRVKSHYANTHNITLIRIPYWDQKNIPNILDRSLTRTQ